MNGGIRRCQRLPDVTYPVIRRDPTLDTSNRVPDEIAQKTEEMCGFRRRASYGEYARLTSLAGFTRRVDGALRSRGSAR